MRRGSVDRALLTRVARYARPYAKLYAVVVGAVVGLALLSVVPPLLIRDLIEVAIPAGDTGRVAVLGVIMVAVPLVTGVLEVAQHGSAASIGESVIFDLRRALLRHVQGMQLEFYVGTRTGELMARLGYDVLEAQRAVAGSFLSLLSGLTMVVVTLATMMTIEWRLTLLSMAVLPLFYVAARLVGRSLRAVVRDQMDAVSAVSNQMAESLSIGGALMVKLFGRSDHEDRRFSAAAAEMGRLGVRREVLTGWLALLFSLAGVVGVAVVFWVGATLVVVGDVVVGDVVAMALLLGNLYRPLGWLATAPVELASSVVSFERVFEVLDIPPAITERAGATDLEEVAGRVEFRDVHFRYEPVGLRRARRYSFHRDDHSPDDDLESDPPEVDPGPTLTGVSFVAEPGSLVALVGPSGAGKTTIAYLVPRLLDVSEGSVLIDGRDVRDVTLASLSTTIGMVTQEPFLLHDTIGANLRYARPDATDAEVEAAVRIANLEEAVAAMPAGLDTVVGEQGYRLSGGEKQRLAIARVVLQDPRIVILDEATSHLDAASEALVQEALESLWRNRTSLVIAHRLSTIAAADQILVVEHGRIVERGTHADLVGRDGLYARLYESQTATYAAEQR